MAENDQGRYGLNRGVLSMAVPLPIGSFCIFEEISIDYMGPLPTDEVGISCVLNIVCSTSRYCELFPTEAETLPLLLLYSRWSLDMGVFVAFDRT